MVFECRSVGDDKPVVIYTHNIEQVSYYKYSELSFFILYLGPLMWTTPAAATALSAQTLNS